MHVMLRSSVRGVKTLYTPVYNAQDAATRDGLLYHLRLLDKVLNNSSHSRTLLFESKYKRLPTFVTSRDTTRLDKITKELMTDLQKDQILNHTLQLDPRQKLGKIGLELFLDCAEGELSPTGTTLALALLQAYNRFPSRETLTDITGTLDEARRILAEQKVILSSPADIEALVDQLAFDRDDGVTAKRVLKALDYKLHSDDIVRVVRGNTMSDEIEKSEGWKYPCGVWDRSEAYLRSLELPTRKLVSINQPCMVLVYDGTLREPSSILPTLHYAAHLGRPLLLFVTGEVLGDALSYITIHNNKHRRKDNPAAAVILKYSAADHLGLTIQENHSLLEFLGLPHGVGSIYSPAFSAQLPSRHTAADYYGSVASLKATTGESFLHNPGVRSISDPALRTTLTVRVGAPSELEIDQRRAALDTLLNVQLCHGLASGFVPAHGVALAKAAALLNPSPNRPGACAARDALLLPLDQASRALLPSATLAPRAVADTVTDPDFFSAYLPARTDVRANGFLEPWRALDRTLTHVTSFVTAAASCSRLVARVLDRPPKQAGTSST